MYVEEERLIFWQLFEKKLEQEGNPFTIDYIMGGTVRQWSVVNKNKVRNSKTLEILFLKEGIVRIDIYIENDLSSFERLSSHVEDLREALDIPVYCVTGTRSKFTRRIKTDLHVQYGNRWDYERVITEAIPIVKKYMDFLRRYSYPRNEYLDY